MVQAKTVYWCDDTLAKISSNVAEPSKQLCSKRRPIIIMFWQVHVVASRRLNRNGAESSQVCRNVRICSGQVIQEHIKIKLPLELLNKTKKPVNLYCVVKGVHLQLWEDGDDVKRLAGWLIPGVNSAHGGFRQAASYLASSSGQSASAKQEEWAVSWDSKTGMFMVNVHDTLTTTAAFQIATAPDLEHVENTTIVESCHTWRSKWFGNCGPQSPLGSLGDS